MAKRANLSIHDTSQRVAAALTKDKSLDMSWFDLAAMIDHIAICVNDDLSHIETVAVNLGVPQRDVDLRVACGTSDTAHLIGIWPETVLVVLFQERERVLVIDSPLPIWVTRSKVRRERCLRLLQYTAVPRNPFGRIVSMALDIVLGVTDKSLERQ